MDSFHVDGQTENDSSDSEQEELGPIERVLKDAAYFKELNQMKSKYRSTAHVSPTSNIVERLFSLSKDIMRPNMRQMDPSTLDSRLMLRLNKDLWSVHTLQKCLPDVAAARRASAEISPHTPSSILGRRVRGEDSVVDDDNDL